MTLWARIRGWEEDMYGCSGILVLRGELVSKDTGLAVFDLGKSSGRWRSIDGATESAREWALEGALDGAGEK